MSKLIFSLCYTNFGPNNKNPMGFRFSDPVFPCFWQLGNFVYVNLCKLEAKFFFANIFALTQDTSTKLDTNLDLDEVHRMTLIGYHGNQ